MNQSLATARGKREKQSHFNYINAERFKWIDRRPAAINQLLPNEYLPVCLSLTSLGECQKCRIRSAVSNQSHVNVSPAIRKWWSPFQQILDFKYPHRFLRLQIIHGGSKRGFFLSFLSFFLSFFLSYLLTFFLRVTVVKTEQCSARVNTIIQHQNAKTCWINEWAGRLRPPILTYGLIPNEFTPLHHDVLSGRRRPSVEMDTTVTTSTFPLSNNRIKLLFSGKNRRKRSRRRRRSRKEKMKEKEKKKEFGFDLLLIFLFCLTLVCFVFSFLREKS